MLRFSINDLVRAKITLRGEQLIKDYVDRVNETIRQRNPALPTLAPYPALYPVLDGGRCIETQFWCLMAYFEGSWRTGAESVFEWVEIVKPRKAAEPRPLVKHDPRPPMNHELKTWPQFYHEIEAERKLHEIRKDDRDFQVGDTLTLVEWDPDHEVSTGEHCVRVITYLMRDFPGIEKGYCLMSIAPVPIVEAPIASDEAYWEEQCADARAANDKAQETIDVLRAELTKAQELAESAVKLKALHLEGGKFEMTLELAKEVMAPLAEAAAVLVEEAQNYVEMEVTNRAGARYTLTIRKPNGETPHQLRGKAEREAAAMRAELHEKQRQFDRLTTASTDAILSLVRERDAAKEAFRLHAGDVQSLNSEIAQLRSNHEVDMAEATATSDERLAEVRGQRDAASRAFATEVAAHRQVVDDLRGQLATAQAERDAAAARAEKLQAFKAFVHRRFDEIGITKEPNGKHSAEGCRVGDRIDEIEQRLRVGPREGVTCDCCEKEAEWVRRTQFSGDHFYCVEHARAEKDFGNVDPSYFFWQRVVDMSVL